MTTKHHISTSIPGLLRQSDKVLARMFQMEAADIRAELQARLANGEKLIPSEGCEGFDPVKGCPGHPTPISLFEGVPRGTRGEGGELDITETNTGEECPYELPVIIRDEQNLLN